VTLVQHAAVAVDDAAASARISAEFQGRARQFHSSLIVDSQKALVEMHRVRTTAEQVADRRAANPRPMRDEVLTEIARDCRLVPMDGCLRRTVQRDKKALKCSNVWMIPVLQRAQDWDVGDEEPSVTVLSDIVTIDRFGQVHRDMHSLAAVSLHAIARWYSRAFSTNHAALMADLLMLAAFAESTAQELGSEFELPTGNGGSWRGGFGEIECLWGLQGVCHVRTFF
jgi:hypothetical protein